MVTTYCEECNKWLEPTKGQVQGLRAFTGNTKNGVCRLGYHAPKTEEAAVRLVRQNGFSVLCDLSPYRRACRDKLIRDIK